MTTGYGIGTSMYFAIAPSGGAPILTNNQYDEQKKQATPTATKERIIISTNKTATRIKSTTGISQVSVLQFEYRKSFLVWHGFGAHVLDPLLLRLLALPGWSFYLRSKFYPRCARDVHNLGGLWGYVLHLSSPLKKTVPSSQAAKNRSISSSIRPGKTWWPNQHIAQECPRMPKMPKSWTPVPVHVVFIVAFSITIVRSLLPLLVDMHRTVSS